MEIVGRGEFNLGRFAKYFTRPVNRAQDISIAKVAFVLGKRLFDRHRDAMNERQAKVVARVFREGRRIRRRIVQQEYTSIAKCSPATAARDLAGLQDLGALTSSGKGRATRYEIVAPGPSVIADNAGVYRGR